MSTSFFKIASGQLITFGWNMTSVLVTPTHLTVSAVCDNGNTYPVGPTDGVIPGTATTVVWDPFSYDQANPTKPLAQASYTLHIWDERGPDAVRAAGFMQPNSALKFALYTPQPYTPISSGQIALIPILYTFAHSCIFFSRLVVYWLQWSVFIVHRTASFRRRDSYSPCHVSLRLQPPSTRAGDAIGIEVESDRRSGFPGSTGDVRTIHQILFVLTFSL